uniref:SCP domain-containing protein n=1 Tax=Strongyloides venezuelensis TaxID=75913 RepID=A0A0K0G230_STRVS
MAYDLAVTYATQNMGKRKFFSYQGNIYASRARMVQDIFEDHKSIHKSKILLLNAGIFRRNTEVRSPLKYFYESPFSARSRLKISKVVVIEHFENGRKHYVCLNKNFPNLKAAGLYAHKMNFKLFFCPWKKNHITIPDSMNIFKHVGWFGFSNKIWKRVWKSCYYYACFVKNDFRELKVRLLFEMNKYRLLHRVPPVRFDDRYVNVAETNLYSLMYRKRKVNRDLLKYFVKIPFYLAPLIMKRWYDENTGYKYNTFLAIGGTEHFSAIVWKNVKYVGFAVEELDNMIYFDCVFYPKPNIPEQFKSNVLKKRRSE